MDEIAKRPFRILSLNGGGFRGLFSIEILSRLEKRFGAPLASHFDLIAGTSVGGLLAIAIAAEIPMATLQSTFLTQGAEIFRYSRFQRIRAALRLPVGLLRSQFDPQRIASLTDGLLGPGAKSDRLKVPIVVPAFNVSERKPFEFRLGPRANPRLLRDVRARNNCGAHILPASFDRWRTICRWWATRQCAGHHRYFRSVAYVQCAAITNRNGEHWNNLLVSRNADIAPTKSRKVGLGL